MFHALFRKREDEEPIITPLQKQRDLQIEKMTTFHNNVVEVVRHTDYRIPLLLGNVSITLIILLPPYFPQDKPDFQISPPVLHPWVNDEQKVTGCASLKNFHLHSDLSKIIEDIINEFQMRPPLLDLACHSNAKVPPPPFIPTEMSSIIGTLMNYGTYHPTSGMNLALEVPCCFPELKDLSVEELEHLNNDDANLSEVIDKLPIMQTLEKELEKLSVHNENLASEWKCVDQLTSCRSDYDEYNARFQELAQRFMPASIQQHLKYAALRAEEESEDLALTFLENKMETEEFLHKFLESRTLYHLRRVKEEKLHQQLLDMHRS
uniref:VPS37 C-terminal domain-containing protein n=1 Tax=Strigamia maritima TaxID=126957 RepID=T1IQB7_STRMM